jgi:hypothetical protein
MNRKLDITSNSIHNGYRIHEYTILMNNKACVILKPITIKIQGLTFTQKFFLGGGGLLCVCTFSRAPKIYESGGDTYLYPTLSNFVLSSYSWPVSSC